MFSMIRLLSVHEIFLEQLPILTGSVIIAETFYKFHSFALECIAFLITWILLDAGVKYIKWMFVKLKF